MCYDKKRHEIKGFKIENGYWLVINGYDEWDRINDIGDHYFLDTISLKEQAIILAQAEEKRMDRKKEWTGKKRQKRLVENSGRFILINQSI